MVAKKHFQVQSVDLKVSFLSQPTRTFNAAQSLWKTNDLKELTPNLYAHKVREIFPYFVCQQCKWGHE
jgi:hypothetical protein